MHNLVQGVRTTGGCAGAGEGTRLMPAKGLLPALLAGVSAMPAKGLADAPPLHHRRSKELRRCDQIRATGLQMPSAVACRAQKRLCSYRHLHVRF